MSHDYMCSLHGKYKKCTQTLKTMIVKSITAHLLMQKDFSMFLLSAGIDFSQILFLAPPGQNLIFVGPLL
jgi:hypothetical protein